MVTMSKALHVLAHWMIGLGFSLIHVFHISRLYENQSKFSHLSTLERELQLSPTEAFYYQFYKRIVEAQTFEDGIEQLVHDNISQYTNEGSTINSIRKFHILPEVITGFLYRNFMLLATALNIPTVNCYYVEPDEKSKIDDPKVFINCEGLGEPIFFYLAIIWSLSAITVFLLYMYGYFLHRNIMAGCSVILYYFCVHENATNIHRQPMMRHNFAIPFIVWQTFYFNLYVDRHQSKVDRSHQRNYAMIVSMIIFTTLANVFWEMSTHLFLAQTLAVFMLLQIVDKSGTPYIKTGLALDYAISHVISNWLSYALMYGNMKFLTSGSMSVNAALIIYIVRIKVMRLPSEEENPNFRSPIRRFFYVLFFFLSTSWFVQDLMDRFVVHNYHIEATQSYHIDVILTMFHVKQPSFYSLLTYYRENIHDTITMGTLRVYCVVFIFKNLSVYLAIKFYDMLHQKHEMVQETQERAKNYVIEDFLESNRITMKDLSDPKTEKRIQKDLEILKECNFDYEAYKMLKKRSKVDTKIEKENFLNDIKKLKTQIQKGEKAKQNKDSQPLVVESDEEEAKAREERSGESDDEPTVTEKPEEAGFEDVASLYYVQPFYMFALLNTFTMFFVALRFVFTPFLCLLSATLPSRSWFHKTSSVYWIFYLFLVLCTFNYPGYKNLSGQLAAKSEYRNAELEGLIHWIDKTEPNAVFGAPIEVAAHILLTTKRPVVNHPLIEYQDMIERTRSLYSIFSKRLSTDIYNQLVKLRVQYVVISYDSCFVGSKEGGLRLIDIFDYLEPENYEKKAFCVSLFQKHNPTFLKVFENVKYIVIQIFSQSIQLELNKKGVLEFQM